MSERLDARQRIVITGMGIISPMGLTLEDSWEAIAAGKSGIGFIEPSELGIPDVGIAGQVKGFDGTVHIPRKEIKSIHRCAQLAYAATLEALQNADLVDVSDPLAPYLTEVKPERIGIRMGTGVGGGMHIAEVGDVIRDKGADRIRSTSMRLLLAERPASATSILLGVKGPISATTAACATGSISIVDSVYTIKAGDTDVMITGGTEAAIGQVGLGCFNAMRALSVKRNNAPEEASRPFDADADGFVMAEGAGVLVLESLEHALGRSARIYAEIVGYGNTADAYNDVAPSGEGAVRAMRIALEKAGIDPNMVDYINAHGTSTPSGDPTELDAILEVFGHDNPRLSVSSTKSSVGHLLGAAGGFEAIMCAMAIQKGIAPPTLNLHDPIREGIDLVPLVAKAKPINIALSNSFGFGGINSVLIFRRFDQARR